MAQLDEKCQNEMIRIMGGLEIAVTNLGKQSDSLTQDMKQLTQSVNTIEIASENYKNLPDRVGKLEDVAQDYISAKSEIDKDSERVKFLVRRYDTAMAVAAILNSVALGLIWLYQKGLIKVNI